MWGIDAADYAVLLGTMATLVVLEGLLSADNALVLAVMVRHLPKDSQKRALRYGIIGAFAFRLIAVVFASALLHYWWIKVLGGVYLLYLSLAHLFSGHDDEVSEHHSKFGNGFWATVIGVEVADIAFSIDSILAAVAMAEGLDELGEIALFRVPIIHTLVDMKLMVVYIGGILGIITMRFVAGYFLLLLDRFHGLAVGAYYLVAWIGLKLIGGGLNDIFHPHAGVTPGTWRDSVPPWLAKFPFEMNEWVFWSGMGLIIVISMLIKPRKPAAVPEDLGPATEATLGSGPAAG
ncbi:TerC family protein [Tundrisphaera sp. TA3]|uniref:TerC family protein n=1 Tax=Tundrisphaera sp. TA3 TaxID=3435775 RepID=UPI003EB9DD44